jgi:hypothetical protein
LRFCCCSAPALAAAHRAVRRAGAGPGGSCIAGSLQAMFRYPSCGPRSQPGCPLGQQHSWGCTLRSFTPDRGWLGTFPWAGPTCRFPERSTSMIFVEGRVDCRIHRLTHIRHRLVADALRARLLGFGPAASLPPRPRFPAGNTTAMLPWALPLPGFAGRRSARSRGLVPAVDHQPPETASGSYPLVGFACSDRREMAANQSPMTSLSGTPLRRASASTDATSTAAIRCGPSAC